MEKLKLTNYFPNLDDGKMTEAAKELLRSMEETRSAYSEIVLLQPPQKSYCNSRIMSEFALDKEYIEVRK